MYRVFVDNGLGGLIHFSTDAYRDYAMFRARGLATRGAGQPGDLVVYGGGSHIGIYLGHGRVISALVEGVRVTGVYGLSTPFTAFLHTGLSGDPAALAATRRAAAPVATKGVRRTIAAVLLRALPGTTSRRLAVLAPGTRLAVLRWSRDRQGRRWIDVRTAGGRTGWVAAWLTR